ncbi:MAG: FHA domain-containing protein [Solirubrobacterales bacterium]
MNDPRATHKSTPAELKQRIEAERRGTPFLLFRDPAGAQRLVELDEGEGTLSIGRDPGADVSLEWDGQVSRLHALIERVGGAWTIVDDGLSRNGTFVNGERVRGRRRLEAGDVIASGDTHISYYEPPPEDVGETAMAVDASLDAELSKMQRRVLGRLCKPLRDQGPYATPATNQEIAVAIHLSEVAVKSHLRTLFAKFGLSDLPQNRKRAALAEAALRSGELSDRDFAD